MVPISRQLIIWPVVICIFAALLYDIKAISYVKFLFPSTQDEQPNGRPSYMKYFNNNVPDDVQRALVADIWRGTPMKLDQVCVLIVLTIFC
jgi:hypothetical protein